MSAKAKARFAAGFILAILITVIAFITFSLSTSSLMAQTPNVTTTSTDCGGGGGGGSAPCGGTNTCTPDPENCVTCPAE